MNIKINNNELNFDANSIEIVADGAVNFSIDNGKLVVNIKTTGKTEEKVIVKDRIIVEKRTPTYAGYHPIKPRIPYVNPPVSWPDPPVSPNTGPYITWTSSNKTPIE